MTNEQLVLLEELTYFDKDVWEGSGEVPNHSTDVGGMLSRYDEAKLAEMERKGGNEAKRAAIIREIKNDPDLCNLKIVDKNDDVYAITYQDPNTGEVIVTFRGTATPEEWRDNALGLSETDTPCQKAALEYIEGLPYDGITVVGHSKGGNKAQYVTLLSDKVDRCVSVDGQGFSPEFYEKYYAEVQAKGGLIINYYKDGDFVNILLLPVPGSNQVGLTTSPDVTNVDFHHLESVFQYVQDEDGNWYIVCDENGNPILKEGDRQDAMQYAHEFTCFVVNVMPIEDREKMGQYIGALLAIVRSGGYTYKGVYYTDVMEFLMSDPEMFGMLIAYVAMYVDTYNLSEEEVDSLLRMLSLDGFFEEIRVKMRDDPDFKEKAGDTIGSLFLLLMNNLKDGERDGIIEWLLNKFLGEDAVEVWQETEEAYGKIPDFDKNTANQHGTIRTAKTRDFTQSTYDALMQAMQGIDSCTIGSVSGWRGYAGEEWYDDLLIDNMIRGINTYFNRIEQINQQCRERVNTVFDQAHQVDAANAAKLRAVTEKLGLVAGAVEEIAGYLG